MHVLAAAFYGYLREDRWTERGGSIEKWLDEAVAGASTPTGCTRRPPGCWSVQ